MFREEEKFVTEKEFKEFKENKKILNLNIEKNSSQKAKTQKSNKNSNKSDINNHQKSKSNIDNKNNEALSDKNKSLSQMTSEENENHSKISETSDNEMKGYIFFDKNNRYIFKANYSKEIDGVFSKHKKIALNKKGELDLLDSLDSLLKSQNEELDINNDIRCKLIYKNFQDEEIPQDEPFFLEVKTSMAELTDLLRQIKEISKVFKNASENLPKYVVGIICKFDENQIKFQQKKLNKKYKEDGEDTFYKYVMEIIKDNKINVLIGAIQNEKIFEYPLGIDDFLIEGEKLKKRIDINYMNKKICKGKEVSEDRLQKICIKYPYKSLNYYPVSYDNYMVIHQRYNILKLENKSIKEEKKEMQEKYEKEKEEKKEMQEKYEKKIEELQKQLEIKKKEEIQEKNFDQQNYQNK